MVSIKENTQFGRTRIVRKSEPESESKAARNLFEAVRSMISGIGSGKPWHHIKRLCREQGLDDFPVRDILEEYLGRKLECGGGRSGRWIETVTADPFSAEMRNGIWNFGMG